MRPHGWPPAPSTICWPISGRATCVNWKIVVERAMILHRGEPLSFDDLEAAARPPVAQPPAPTGEEALDLDTVTARHIQQVLKRTGGKIHGPGGAGELLGINPNTLRYRMRKLGIPFRKHQRGE